MSQNFTSFHPVRPNMITYPIPAEGIELEVLQENICSFLGPEAYARINLNQRGVKEYMITALKPFTNSQLNDLRAFSAELIEYISENFKPQTYHHVRPTCMHQTSYYTSYSGEINGPGQRGRRMANLQAKGALINLQISYPTIHNTYITSNTSTDHGPCSHSCAGLWSSGSS
ncbi:hypothetical protein P167DRAFT_120232 [Morchella conica CCBAS932]|uniref:Uncharacterized protein n=1 Tax=Morchella conica CCBAS932 TaxID=1392247 RepID=A0A3N4L6S9_9PEZI|nr:hypothetical protein P167DRAFT_120232 [Morchella conica CCBAS932]